MKATVDRGTCIGCELCVQTCPEVFRMEEVKAIAYVDIVPAENENSCRAAVDICPVTAISISE